nr:Sec-independent protein translocase component TatC [Polysiphonia sp.]
MAILFLKELVFYLRYFTSAFILVFFFITKWFLWILIFFYYPIGKILKKKLLILHIWELLQIYTIVSVNFSNLFIIFWFFYLLRSFLTTSWYKAQLALFNQFIQSFLYCFVLIFVLFYSFNYFVLSFVLFWNFDSHTIFDLFEIQFQLLRFLQFQLCNLNTLIFCSICSICSIFLTKWFLEWKFIFFFFKKIKLTSLQAYILLFTFLNFDFIILSFFPMLLFLEFIYFFICFKIC